MHDHRSRWDRRNRRTAGCRSRLRWPKSEGTLLATERLSFVQTNSSGVKFGRVAGERIGVQAPVAGQQSLDGVGPVGPSPIPQQDHGAPDVAQEVPKELGHLRRSNVLIGMESHIQRHTPSLGGHPQRRDGRDFGPVARHRQPGGLPARRPGADDVRDEQEAALVEKDQMGPKLSGLFLYVATRVASSTRSPLRCVPGPASEASGSSTPAPLRAATCGWGDTAPETVLRSPPRPGAPSRGPWHSHAATAPRPGFSPRSAAAGSSASAVCLEPAWLAALLSLPSATGPSTDTPSLRHTRSSWPRPTALPCAPATRWPVGAAIQAAPGSHVVSWNQGTIFLLLMRTSIVCGMLS